MKAVRIHRFGGPDVLQLDDVPTPGPGEGEVLVRIAAASVNPVDYKIRSGGYPQVKQEQLPMIMGRDACGVVERCGPGVGTLKPGDAVYAMLPRDRGGYAEYVAASAAAWALKPDTLDEVNAAAIPLAALTAWQGLFDNGALVQGQSVLIHGAAGGVGHFAVQFARARGATVAATGRGEDLEFLKSLGAVTAIDYKTQRFEDHVHDVDVVFDLVAGETQDRSWSVIKPGGIIVSTLKAPDPKAAEAHKARGLHYFAVPNGAELAEIARLVDAGEVKPVIDRTYPLAQGGEAQRRLEKEHVRGKIVLTTK
jgi:NADPH:quinone reductase-like Zn-dependent oxidoreductase